MVAVSSNSLPLVILFVFKELLKKPVDSLKPITLLSFWQNYMDKNLLIDTKLTWWIVDK